VNGIVGFEPLNHAYMIKLELRLKKTACGGGNSRRSVFIYKFYASFSGEAVIWLCFRAGVAFLLVRAWLQKKEPII